MAQPMIDTLRVADTLRRTGMEREQAEGLAGTLGTELGEHVVSRKDLESGFAGIRAQMDTRFAEVDARFTKIDARFTEIDARFARVDARLTGIEARFDGLAARLVTMLDTMNTQFKFVFAGFALVGVMLAAVMGMIGVLHANPSLAQPITLQLAPGMSVGAPGAGQDARAPAPPQPREAQRGAG